MKEKHKEIILAFAENNMGIRRTAKALCFGQTTVACHLDQIKEVYGLNPKNFYDLCKLVEMAQES